MAVHVSVLLQESIDALAIRPDGVYVDATFGEGGHARAILERLDSAGRLIAIEIDPRMARANTISDARMILVESDFAELARIVSAAGFEKIDGVLADLGISARHYAERDWGFSYTGGPLDMRLTGHGQSAADIINGWPAKDMARLLLKAGEQSGRKIAAAIERQRPIAGAAELARLIEQTVPRLRGSHPATKTFRALREAVTGELDQIDPFLNAAVALLKPGGRIVVLAYTSDEIRIVRQTLSRYAPGGRGRREATVEAAKTDIRWIEKKGVTPAADELQRNPSARSARLLAALKTE